MAFNKALANAQAIVKAYQKGGMVAVKRFVQKTGTSMNLSGARGLIKRHETMTANMSKPRKEMKTAVSKKKVVAKKKTAKKATKKVAKKKVVATKKVAKKSKYSRNARTA